MASSVFSQRFRAGTSIPVIQVNEAWFDDQLRRVGDGSRKLTHRQAAEILGFGEDHTKVTRTLAGNRDMHITELPRWAKLLNVPIAEVVRDLGIEVPARSTVATVVSVKGWVDSLGAVHSDRPSGPRMAECPVDAAEGAVALRYHTGGGQMDGWVMFYRPYPSISQAALDRLCVVQTSEEQRLVRFVKRGYEIGTFNLLPFSGMGCNTGECPNLFGQSHFVFPYVGWDGWI